MASNKAAPEHLRTLALVVVKNCVHTHWVTQQTKQGPVGVLEEEKVAVRVKVLQMIEQPSTPVAVQLALLIGKIARHDFPSHWYAGALPRRLCRPSF